MSTPFEGVLWAQSSHLHNTATLFPADCAMHLYMHVTAVVYPVGGCDENGSTQDEYLDAQQLVSSYGHN
jgi:hypothetical protein